MGNTLPHAERDAEALPNHRLRFLLPTTDQALPEGKEGGRRGGDRWFEYRLDATHAAWERRGPLARPPEGEGEGATAAVDPTVMVGGEAPGPAPLLRYDLRLGADGAAVARFHLSPDGRRAHRVQVPASVEGTPHDPDRWLPRSVPLGWLAAVAAAARLDFDACVACTAAPALCRMPPCGHRCLCPRCLLRLRRAECPVCRADLRSTTAAAPPRTFPVTYQTLVHWIDRDDGDARVPPGSRVWTDPLAGREAAGGSPPPAIATRLELEDAVHRVVERLDVAAMAAAAAGGGGGGASSRMQSGAYGATERMVLDRAWSTRLPRPADDVTTPRRRGEAADALRRLLQPVEGEAVERLGREVFAQLASPTVGDAPRWPTWDDVERYAMTRATDGYGSWASLWGRPGKVVVGVLSRGDEARREAWRHALLGELVRRCVVYERVVERVDDVPRDETTLQGLVDCVSSVARVWLMGWNQGRPPTTLTAAEDQRLRLPELRAFAQRTAARGTRRDVQGAPLPAIVDSVLAWMVHRDRHHWPRPVWRGAIGHHDLVWRVVEAVRQELRRHTAAAAPPPGLALPPARRPRRF